MQLIYQSSWAKFTFGIKVLPYRDKRYLNSYICISGTKNHTQNDANTWKIQHKIWKINCVRARYHEYRGHHERFNSYGSQISWEYSLSQTYFKTKMTMYEHYVAPCAPALTLVNWRPSCHHSRRLSIKLFKVVWFTIFLVNTATCAMFDRLTGTFSHYSWSISDHLSLALR